MKQLLLALATLSLGACATHVPMPGVPSQFNPSAQNFHAVCTATQIAVAVRHGVIYHAASCKK